MAYSNGRLPDSALGFIAGTNQRVLVELVPQTNALRAAFYARFGKALSITDAYRSYARQVELKREKGPYAATPGTSNHGWGRAIDFGSRVHVENSAEYLWMKANAGRFGWYHPRWAEDNNPNNGQQEPWHWEATVVPVSDYKPTNPGTIPSVPDIEAPAPITPKERQMRVIQPFGKAATYITSGTDLDYIASKTALHDWLRVCGQTTPDIVGQEVIDRLNATVTARQNAIADKAAAKVLASLPEATANSVWKRTLGLIKGKPRTAGQGLRMSAQDAVGDSMAEWNK